MVMKEQVKEQQDKRNLILDAALYLFSERGFHATTIDMIAEAASVGKGTVYLYFSSKEELLGELIFRAMRAQIEEAKGALALPDPWERLKGVLAAGKLFLSRNAALTRVLTTESIEVFRNSHFKEELSLLREEYLKVVIEALAIGQKEGSFRGDFSPPTLGRLLVSLRMGIAAELIQSQVIEIPEGLIAEAMDLIRRGIGDSKGNRTSKGTENVSREGVLETPLQGCDRARW